MKKELQAACQLAQAMSAKMNQDNKDIRPESALPLLESWG